MAEQFVFGSIALLGALLLINSVAVAISPKWRKLYHEKTVRELAIISMVTEPLGGLLFVVASTPYLC